MILTTVYKIRIICEWYQIPVHNNPSDTETEIVYANYVNTLPADALASCMVLTLCIVDILVFLGREFKEPEIIFAKKIVL